MAQNGDNTIKHIFVDSQAIRRNRDTGSNDPTVTIRLNDDPATDRKFHSVEFSGPAVVRWFEKWPNVRIVTLFEVNGITDDF
jgi:hypothetical protein